MPNEIEIEQNVSVSSDDSIDEIDAEEIAQILAEAQLILAYKLPTEVASHAVQIKLGKIQHLFRSVINSTPNFIKWLAGLTPSGSALIVSTSRLLEAILGEKQQWWLDLLGKVPTISPAILHVCAALLIFKNRWAASKDLEAEQGRLVAKINALVKEVCPEIDMPAAQEAKNRANTLFGVENERRIAIKFKQALPKKSSYPSISCFLPSVLITVATIVPQAIRLIANVLESNRDSIIWYDCAREAASILNVGISIAILIALLKKDRDASYNKSNREKLSGLDKKLQKAREVRQQLISQQSAKVFSKLEGIGRTTNVLFVRDNKRKAQIKTLFKTVDESQKKQKVLLVKLSSEKRQKRVLNKSLSNAEKKYENLHDRYTAEKTQLMAEKRGLGERIDKSQRQYKDVKNEYDKRERVFAKKQNEFNSLIEKYESEQKRQKTSILELKCTLKKREDQIVTLKDSKQQSNKNSRSSLLKMGRFSKETNDDPLIEHLTNAG
jgi:hypothetical protein